MLQRLLDLVSEGGLRSYADLARELGVSEELVGQMIEHLAQRGYLRSVAGDCQAQSESSPSTQCAGCDLAGACAIGGPAQVWTLTEKGRRGAEST
jgi:predicted ArsR family transcriptional regulator